MAVWIVGLMPGAAAFAQSCTGTGTGGCQQISCSNGTTTSVSGTVYAPNGADPLSNILVYIPTAALSPFTDGVNPSNPEIDDMATLVSGSPLVMTTTAADGTFTLNNVPPGSQIPVVIQAGRWRREFVISTVASCQNTALTTVTQGGSSSLSGYGESTTVRFAQTQNEGDVPKMALVTGKADALECTLRKVGIADTEFTDYTVDITGGSTTGRVNLFEGAGDSGVKAGTTVHTENTLVGSTSTSFSGSLLGNYNVLMLPCQGDSTDYTTHDGRTNVIAFTGAGGRIFGTHHSAFYLDQDASIDTAVNWTSDSSLASGPATINTAFTSGNTLAQWLQDLGTTTTLGQITLNNNFHDQTGVNSPTEVWATLNSNSDVMQLSFYTPVGNAASSQYGRVMYNEYHVDNTTTSSSVTFPAECTGTMAKTQTMSAQEHMLEYSLFDLMNFAVPVASTNVSIAVTPSPSSFTGGDQADTVDVSVTNNGAAAIAVSPTVTLTVTLPSGLTPVSMSDPAGNWSCNVGTLTCTLLNPLGPSNTNSISLTVAVAANVAAGNASIGATVASAGFVASTTGNVSLTVVSAPANTVTGPLETAAPTTNVGSTAATGTSVTFGVSAGTTISSILVVTEGQTGQDFTNAGSGTCAAQNYATAASCTVVVNFSPKFPGERIGAVEILGTGNTLLDTAYISGIGSGPEAIFQPGTLGVVASESGNSNFDDVAVDYWGNVYIVDFPNNEVLEETPSGSSYTASTPITGLSGPAGIAIDGAGNLYIADTTGSQLLKQTRISGSYVQSTIGTGLSGPQSVALDGEGNVYIADSGNNRVLLEMRSGGSYLQSTIDAGLNNPGRVAVDVAGNVYVADTGNNRVLLETVSNGAYTESTIVGGLNAPQGVAVDSNGDVYIADSGNNRVIEEQLVSGSYVQSVLVTGLHAPRGVAVDERGNLFIADYGDNTLYRQDYSDPPSLTFASTTVNTVSSDSPQIVTLENFGNTALNAVSPGISAPTDFPQETGNGSDCSTSFSLAAAASCALRIEFDPQSSGSHSESFVLTDNNLNVSPSTQTIAVSGQGNPPSVLTISPTSLTAPVIGGSYSQALSASGGPAPYSYTILSGSLPAGLTLSSSGVLSGTPTATGSFSFTVQVTDAASATATQSYSFVIAAPTILVAPASLSGGTLGTAFSQTIAASGGSGSYSFATTSGSLPAGLSLNSATGVLSGTPTSAGVSNFTITATDTVTSGSGAPYSGSRNYSLTIAKAPAPVTLDGLSETYTGSAISVTATTTPGGLSVTVTYDGSATPPIAAGSYTVVATINDPNYQGSATGTLVIHPATPVVVWTSPAPIPYGTALSGTQLDATVNGVPGTFAYSPASGTLLNAGANQVLSVTFTPEDSTDYTSAGNSVTLTVTQAPTTVRLASKANPILAQTAATFTATVSSASGTPGGAVNFLSGTETLGSSPLSGGVASLTTSALPTGSDSITAEYSGNTNFAASSSSPLSESVVNFNVAPVAGSGSQGGSASETVSPGGTATYTIAITPTSGAALPASSLLTVTGLPPGATATLLTKGWTQLTATSWTLPAAATLSDVSLAFHVPAQTTSLNLPAPTPGKFPPPLLGMILLLPVVFGIRSGKRRFGWARSAILMAATLVTVLGMTGCGSKNGFYVEQEQAKSYVVTVTVTSGGVSHSANITLTVNNQGESGNE